MLTKNKMPIANIYSTLLKTKLLDHALGKIWEQRVTHCDKFTQFLLVINRMFVFYSVKLLEMVPQMIPSLSIVTRTIVSTIRYHSGRERVATTRQSNHRLTRPTRNVGLLTITLGPRLTMDVPLLVIILMEKGLLFARTGGQAN